VIPAWTDGVAQGSTGKAQANEAVGQWLDSGSVKFSFSTECYYTCRSIYLCSLSVPHRNIASKVEVEYTTQRIRSACLSKTYSPGKTKKRWRELANTTTIFYLPRLEKAHCVNSRGWMRQKTLHVAPRKNRMGAIA
jgi:hypothetical protein